MNFCALKVKKKKKVLINSHFFCEMVMKIWQKIFSTNVILIFIMLITIMHFVRAVERVSDCIVVEVMILIKMMHLN